MPAVGAAWRCAATAQKRRGIVRVCVAKEQANDCIKIVVADDKNILDISSLFQRFFEEEDFLNTREAIAAHIEVMRHNENC